ncbi:MAG: LysM peptidoglycan-binding domain-containing protein [bacterium]
MTFTANIGPTPRYRFHQIRDGENFAKIADKYSTTPENIKAQNPEVKDETGEMLVINQ